MGSNSSTLQRAGQTEGSSSRLLPLLMGAALALVLLTIASCGSGDDLSTTTPPDDVTVDPSVDPVSSTEPEDQPEPNTESAAPVDATEPADDATPSPAAASGFTGSAKGKGDVGTPTSSPLNGGTVALIPVADEGSLWDAIGYEPVGFQIHTAGGSIPADGIPSAVLMPIVDGTFNGEPADGDYLACLLRGDGPWSLAGCARITFSAPSTWSLSFGEGGVDVSERT